MQDKIVTYIIIAILFLFASKTVCTSWFLAINYLFGIKNNTFQKVVSWALPPIGHNTTNGCGTMFYGHDDEQDVELKGKFYNSHITTQFLVILWIPVIPLYRTRIIQHGKNYQILSASHEVENDEIFKYFITPIFFIIVTIIIIFLFYLPIQGLISLV